MIFCTLFNENLLFPFIYNFLSPMTLTKCEGHINVCVPKGHDTLGYKSKFDSCIVGGFVKMAFFVVLVQYVRKLVGPFAVDAAH